MTETTEADLEQPTYSFESLGVHAGLSRKENEVVDAAIYASTSFVFENSAHGAAIFNGTAEAFCYSRIGNPTTKVFETRVAALEGGEAALATSSGAAALFTMITSLAQHGSNIVVASLISDSWTHVFQHRLPTWGIMARLVSSDHIEQIVQAIDEDTKFVFAESIPSDNLRISDIEALATATHSKGVPLVIDNTAGAGGYLIRPLDHGADIVIQDAGPWLSVSGSISAGIIVDSGRFDWSKSAERYPQFFDPSAGFHGLKFWEKFGNLSFITYARAAVMRDSGPCLNPFEAFQLISGLETLSVRLERISYNAFVLAAWIDERKDTCGIQRVLYPGLSYATVAANRNYIKRGLGGLLSITLADMDVLPRLLRKVTLISLRQSIGGSKTIIVPQPSISAKSQPKAWISVGLENIDDIIKDFAQAISDTEI